MKSTKHILLFLMLLSYLIPIFYIYSHTTNNDPSVSDVICKENCQHAILIGMIAMGVFTIYYELNRSDKRSLISIFCLLVGIYGVIIYHNKKNETLHYLFATIVFLSILGFMIHHCYETKSVILQILLSIQILFLVFLIINFSNTNNIFFISEVSLILNFALFYLYLHFL